MKFKMDSGQYKLVESLCADPYMQGPECDFVKETEAIASELCGCAELEIEVFMHATPSDVTRPFELYDYIVEVAPQCSNSDVEINDVGCSVFAYSNDALAAARKRADELAEKGYEGTITISGNQTINSFALVDSFMSALEIQWTDFSELKKALAKLTEEEVRAYLRDTQQSCEVHYGSELQFKVCANDVTLGLPPCKTPGVLSIVDKEDNGGSPIIVCEHNGKKANQDCEDRGTSDAVQDEYLDQSGENITDFFDPTVLTICEWQDPVGC